MALDQVDQAIISQALIAAAKEMGIKLVRSAYSPIVREANDCSTALLDVRGNVVMKALAQAVPEQVMTAGFDTTHSTCLSHLDEQGYGICLEIFGGGYGESSSRSP